MTIWLIDPHEPLIFREGKPFTPTPGARAKSLPFPFPSTTTGAFRSQSHLNRDGIFFLPEGTTLEQVKQVAVRGPLLVRLEQDGSRIDAEKGWLVPAPADALVLNARHSAAPASITINEQDMLALEAETQQKQLASITQLVPLTQLPEQRAFTDLTGMGREGQESLLVVGQPQGVQQTGGQFNPEKPRKNAPKFWYWSRFQQWLINPGEWPEIDLTELGIAGLPQEIRVHVAMNAQRHVGIEGALFDTSGLEFTLDPGLRLHDARPLALALLTDDSQAEIQESHRLGTLGGERRLVTWRKSDSTGPETCPAPLMNAILRPQQKQKHYCRVILLTPAYFAQGYRPGWLCEERAGIRPILKAIAIQRPQVVSGWNFERPVGPKPSRRLAPAGTVLFLELEGDERNIPEWIQQIWFQCISDDIEGVAENAKGQYRRDGFGLAVVGTWTYSNASNGNGGAR